MKKHFLFGLSMVILAVGSTVWSGVSAQTRQPVNAGNQRATDAAYRDGLFLGKFDGRAGKKHRACVGRWSTQLDRTSFASGYADGYAQAMASNAEQIDE